MADINGTAGADLLFGAAADDLIAGGDQRDILYGGAGDDILLGGEGDDVLYGEAGNDRLEGGAGNDSLSSTDQGSDTLIGGEGSDVLYVLRTRTGDSFLLDGGAGNDRLIIELSALAGIDASAGDGDDSIEIYAIRNTLTLSLGAGRDLVHLLNFKASVQGGGRIVISDFEAGAAGDQISFSNVAPQDFTGWNPNTNPFGAGYLKAVQSGANVVVSASFAANGAFVEALVLQNVTLASLTPENLGGWTIDGSLVPPVLLVGTDAGETFRGHGGADDLEGLGGDDILEGHAGADLLKGGDGNDVLRGGFGNDRLHGGIGNDSLSSGGGNDDLYGEDGNDILTLSVPFGTTSESLFGSGGAGHDSITISTGFGGVPSAASFTVDAGSGEDLVTISSLTGAATIALGDGRDRIDIDSFTKSTTSIATIEITDFAAGDGGDRLQWTSFVFRTLGAIGPDPFASGHMRLLQSGADALLQIDRNGGGDQFVTLITFRNSDAAAFTAYNLGGFAPGAAAVAGATITGTGDPDRLFGTDGDDVIDGGDERDVLIGNHGDDLIRGGAGDDSISGYDGDDVLEGGDGNDIFNAGRGDDLIDGGEGNDRLDDSSGSKGFVGGAGDDSVYFSRFNSQDVLVASGGDGNDYFSARITGLVGSFAIDGDAGDDVFDVAGTGDVTLGSGVDHLRFVDSGGGGSGVVVHDFVAGDSGDRMSFASLVSRFTNFDYTANPFSTGHLKLVASGSDTGLMVDFDGPTGSGNPIGVAILLGIEKFSLTSHNVGGYALPFARGTAADEEFQGTAGDDEFIGGGGDDTFLIGYGGHDKAVGDTGDDLFFVATGSYGPAPRSVGITGGGGSDTLRVQSQESDYLLLLRPGGAPYLNAIDATGISKVEFLSGFDAGPGWVANKPLNYYVTIEDGFSAPGAPLLLDTTRLAASEGFYMHAENIKDQDVFLRLIGGAGVDHIHAGAGGSHLDGGGGDDEFYTGLGDDTLLGGEGTDDLNSDVGYSRSGTDLLDGGAGDDRLEIAAGDQGSWTSVTLLGGDGNDYIFVNVQGGISPGTATIDAGAGNDRLKVQAATGTYNVTLGSGSDTVEIVDHRFYGINSMAGANKSISIADFDPGPGGDTLLWGTAVNAYLGGGYVGFHNPFRTGHARLIQDGADVLLQLSRLADGNFITLLRLQNHLVEDFAGGIGYFATAGLDGTSGSDLLTGTANGDFAYGLGGDDLFRFEQGAADYAEGGEGNDVLYLGNTFSGSDAFHGGNGSDELVLQGTGSGILTSVSGVETVTLLGGADPRFGPVPYTGSVGFNLTAVDGNVAAGGLLTVNGSGLGSGEAMLFNGAAEFNGRFAITGGAGADRLTGGSGNDELRGGEGADRLVGGAGDDQLSGEGGDDILDEIGSGSDTISGGEGADLITLTRGSFTSDSLTATGGDGADRFIVSMTGGSTLSLDAGEGDDIVTLKGSANVSVTMGAGSDTLDLSQFVRTAGVPQILDFQTGTGGDAIGWGSWLNLNIFGWYGQGDPFQKGYLRLAQKGADVYLQMNSSGNGGLSGTYETILIFRNADKAAFTTANFGGYAPLNLTGTGSPDTLTGSQGDDIISGGGGDDLLLVHQGGTDILRGGDGDDRFFFGGRLPQSWQVGDSTGLLLDGGAGIDTVIFQGVAFYGWPLPTTGIERVKLLSGTDNSFNTGGAKIAGQYLRLHNPDLAAGATLTIDASGLLDGEKATVDAISESDGELIFLGGAGDDFVSAGSGGSELSGGAGNDRLDVSHGGTNLVDGGSGNDVIIGGYGVDTLNGGSGDDTISDTFLGTVTIDGGADNDVINLGNGSVGDNNVLVSGGSGNDRISLNTGTQGSVSIDGGSGADIVDISGAKGTIIVTLGEGQDVFNIHHPQYVLRSETTLAITDFAAGNGGDRFDLASILASGMAGYQTGGNPFLTGHARVVQSGGDTLLQIDRDGSSPSYGFVTYVTLQGVDASSLRPFNLGFAANVSGATGNWNLVGTSAPDWIEGGASDDRLDGGAGADTMWGAGGSDVYIVDHAGDSVRESSDEGLDEVRTGLATYVLAANVENLTATSDSAHDFRGNAGNNVVTGGGGNDFLRLQDGGNDIAVGGAGNDVFLFGGTLSSGDQVAGGVGADQIAIQGDYAGAKALALGANVTGIENLAILPGSDARFGDPGTNFYDYDLTLLDVAVAAGVELVVDANRLRLGEDFTFDGSAESDGSFFIYGGGGTDLLTGGAKNDVFLFGAGGQWGATDVIDGGSGGIDQLALRGNYTLTFGAGQLIGIENIGLLSAHDTRFGVLGSSYTYDLTMTDANVASGVQMTVDGARLRIAENFTFNGSAELDGSFRVFGGLVDDVITGSRNADLIQGNDGADTLTGGAGADIFRYFAASDSTAAAADRILDFTPGSDKIDLSRIDSSTATAGDQAFSWIGSNAFSGSAGQLRAFQQGGDWILEGDTDGNGSADFVVRLSLEGPTPLTGSDFFL